MGLKTNLAIAAGLLLLAVVVVVPPATLLSPRTSQFRATFRQKCQAFPETRERCEQLLSMFEEAYVGQDPCNFPDETYHPLFVESPFTHSCDKTMFWSDTKDLVHQFCKGRNHFISLENTLLGNILDGLTWCGKKTSTVVHNILQLLHESSQITLCPVLVVDTFFYLCEKCDINTVSSFWVRASAEFADYACGNASVLLNAAISKPFDPTSYFGAVEVRKLAFPRVQSLTVILVIKNDNADCSHESLQVLRDILDPSITLHCRSVTESKILECVESGITTDACWTQNYNLSRNILTT